MDETLLMLLHRLRDGEIHEQIEAARLMAANPPSEDADLAAKGLLGLLRSPDAELRGATLEALGALGQAAKPAAPAIAKLLLTEEGPLFAAAIAALEQLGPRALAVALECLLQALKGPDDELRSAARTVGRLGPKHANLLDEATIAAAQDELTRAVKFRPDGVRGVAAAALLDLGVSGQRVRDLMEPLETKHRQPEEPAPGSPPLTIRQKVIVATLSLGFLTMLGLTVFLAVRLAADYPLAVGAVIGTALLAVGASLYFYYRCPSCKRPFGARLVRREIAKREIQTRVVRDGDTGPIPETKIKTVIVRHYRCRWCGHDYTQVSG